jgi:two-component system sensor histidine kinase QseC
MFSLRFLLSLLMLVGIVLSVSMSNMLSIRDAKHEIEELFDAQMVQHAKMLEVFYVNQLSIDKIIQLSDEPIKFHVSNSEVESFADNSKALTLLYEQKMSFQILSNNKQLLAYSDVVGREPLSDFIAGYQAKTINNELWHIFSLFSDSHKVWIITAQRDDVREELVDELIANTWISPLIVTPLVLLLMLLATYLLFRPVKLLKRHLNSRSPQDLSPLNMPLPKELIPIQAALNGYLQRMGDAMVRERRFSADAAHELKTPLTIIKLHSDGLKELLSESAHSKTQEAITYIEAMDQGVKHMSHTVEQLLLLSRVDAIAVLNKSACSLDDIIQNSLNQLIHIIADYQWQIAIPEGLTVSADPFYLELVCKNIIENACKYSPKESLIQITAAQVQDGLVMSVIDQGKGMTAAEISRATERFYRVDENGFHGAGLGLAICQHIISLHGGALMMEAVEPKGLKVSLSLPTGDMEDIG